VSGYRERPARAPAAVLWERTARAGQVTRILPDTCMDLIWDGAGLVVAGPDTRARDHVTRTDVRFTGLRFSAGLGPALLGVPADEVRDTSPGLADLWGPVQARELAERAAADPAGALEAWLVPQVARREPDPLGAALARMARAGLSPAAMADAAGLSSRQLHRRCSALYGYGPRHLLRVVRMERALAQARSGAPLARVAQDCGYADQAHLTREVRDLAGAPPRRLLTSAR
jgi:AraC-like DNA-binding protein